MRVCQAHPGRSGADVAGYPSFFSWIVARETIVGICEACTRSRARLVRCRARWKRATDLCLFRGCFHAPRQILPGSPQYYPTNMSCFSDIFPERVKRHVVTTTAWSFYGKKVPPFV